MCKKILLDKHLRYLALLKKTRRGAFVQFRYAEAAAIALRVKASGFDVEIPHGMHESEVDEMAAKLRADALNTARITYYFVKINAAEGFKWEEVRGILKEKLCDKIENRKLSVGFPEVKEEISASERMELERVGVRFDCQLRFSLNECCENLKKINVGDAIKQGAKKAGKNKKRNNRKKKNFKRAKQLM